MSKNITTDSSVFRKQRMNRGAGDSATVKKKDQCIWIQKTEGFKQMQEAEQFT